MAMVQLRVTDAALQEDGSCRRGGEMFLGATGAFREVSGRRGASLHVPIRPAPHEVLMTDLEASDIVCEVSTVTDARLGALVPGQRFDGEAMSGLPDGEVRFGENGEVTPLAEVWRVVDLP